jgi:hypothetical protein
MDSTFLVKHIPGASAAAKSSASINRDKGKPGACLSWDSLSVFFYVLHHRPAIQLGSRPWCCITSTQSSCPWICCEGGLGWALSSTGSVAPLANLGCLARLLQVIETIASC